MAAFFHLSPRLCPSTAECGPPSMPSVCCFPVPGGSLLPCYVVLPSSTWPSPRSLPSPWLPLCAAFSPPIVLHSCYMSGHLHFCFSVYSIMSIIFVLFLISEHGILSCSFRWLPSTAIKEKKKRFLRLHPLSLEAR